MSKSAVITRLLFIFGILVLINFLANRMFFRLDFTADKRYTLSEATKNILKGLDRPITVKAYFSENLPANIAKTRRDFREQLIEFSTWSNGRLVFEFINPNADEVSERKAQQAGISPILVDIRERDQIKQQRAYLGAVVQLGEQKEVIPVIQPGAAMEYALATSIKKLSVDNKPKIALIQGHGEAGKMDIPQAMQSLGILYDVEDFELSDTSHIPESYKTIVIIDPKDTITDIQLRQIDDYLAQGRNVLISLSRVKGDLQNASAQKNDDTGFEKWLQGKGITVEDNFLRDINCGSVTVQQRQAFFNFNSQVKFPYFPIIANFPEHPITTGIEAVIMPFVSGIAYVNPDTSRVKITPLALTSNNTGVEKPPFMFDISRQWVEDDFTLGALPIAIALHGKIHGEKRSKMVVISNGGFAVNGKGQAAQRVNPDNVNLIVNAIDWLSDDTGLIELRTKGITSRPLEQIEDDSKTIIKYSNVFAPIILILIYGFIRYHYQRRKRQKWMTEDY